MMLGFAKKMLSSWWTAVLFAVAGSLLFVFLFGHKTYNIDGLRINADVTPSYRGETQIIIPPFGEVTAKTHGTPIKVLLETDRIYLEKLWVNINSPDRILHELEIEGKQAINDFALVLLAIGVVGGALGAALSANMRGFKAIAGAFVGAIVIGLLLTGTYNSYNVSAFTQPRYTGALSVAPWVVDEVANGIGNLSKFRRQISQIASNINSYYSQVETWQPIENNAIRVLHISDIHNNPAAFDLIQKVTADFDIDFIIDTGDITDYGTPIENQLINRISGLSVPYMFIPGNHDSSSTVNYLRTMDNVTVLKDGTTTAMGINILGISDPQADTYEIAPPSSQIRERTQIKVKRVLSKMRQKPHILAVHNPWIGKELLDRVPIVLVGHTHKASVLDQNESVIINAGTTGAAGIRNFEVDENIPYSLNILQIDRKSKQLMLVDTMLVKGNSNEFVLERHRIDSIDDIDGSLEETETVGDSDIINESTTGAR